MKRIGIYQYMALSIILCLSSCNYSPHGGGLNVKEASNGNHLANGAAPSVAEFGRCWKTERGVVSLFESKGNFNATLTTPEGREHEIPNAWMRGLPPKECSPEAASHFFSKCFVKVSGRERAHSLEFIPKCMGGMLGGEEAMINAQLVDIPEDYCCPITQDLMNEPVVVADGHTYEKAAIIRWIETGHITSPLTGSRLGHFNLTDNFALKKVIDDFRERLPQIQRERQIKVDLDKAVKLREEMVAHYLEKKEQENLMHINDLANERIKNQKLEKELEETKQELVSLKQVNQINQELQTQMSTMTEQIKNTQKIQEGQAATAFQQIKKIQEEQAATAFQQIKKIQEEQAATTLQQMQEMQKMMENMQNMFLAKKAHQEKQNSQIFMPQYEYDQQKINLNPQEVQKFLDLVARGAQGPAENMLQQNPDLALAKGEIVDHAQRKFEDITGFQYAVWALDWEMWEMIMEYMPVDAQKEQAAELDKGPWVVEHKEHVDWQGLIDALQTYLNNYNQWDGGQCKNYWVQQCGGAQLILPYHVFQEYDHPTRSFDPTPDFTKKQLSGNTRAEDQNFKHFKLQEVGNTYTIIRGYHLHPMSLIRSSDNPRRLFHLTAVIKDSKSLQHLRSTRSQQREKLLTELITLDNIKKPKP